MGNTKKVGSTGRFGSRAGVGIRKKLLKIEPKQFSEKKCPNCGAMRVKRLSKGIFKCSKCSYEFVGGAYFPQTLSGGLIAQMVIQKQFTPELLSPKTTEVVESDEGSKKGSDKKHGKVAEKAKPADVEEGAE